MIYATNDYDFFLILTLYIYAKYRIYIFLIFVICEIVLFYCKLVGISYDSYIISNCTYILLT